MRTRNRKISPQDLLNQLDEFDSIAAEQRSKMTAILAKIDKDQAQRNEVRRDLERWMAMEEGRSWG